MDISREKVGRAVADNVRRQPTEKRQEKTRDIRLTERIERAKYVYEQVNGWIENADAKVGVSCGLFFGVFGVVSFLSEHFHQTSDPNTPVKINEGWSNAHTILLIGSLIFMGIALILYVLSIVPNLKSSATRSGKKPFLLFYGDIANVSIKEFRKVMLEAGDRDFLDEIVSEAHHNAGVCNQKMRLCGKAVRLSIAAILMALGSWAANVLMYV